MHVLKRPRLKLANDCLLAAIVVINLYIIAAPLVPRFDFWWQSHHTAKTQQLRRIASKPTGSPAPQQPNSLVIPAMLLNQPTLEGPANDWFDLLYKGIWRWPGSSTPDKGGNTVFLAHRFSYTGPRGAFYFLNKLRPGDDIEVIWNQRTYHYTVVSSTEVPPTDTAIENDTPDARITLFTCTPLWHPVDRLVVVAELKGSAS